MEQAKKNFYGEKGVFVRSGGSWTVSPEIRSMVDPFVDLCIRQGVTRIKEWNVSPEAYRSAMYRLFFQGRNEHLAYGKPVRFLSPDISAVPEDKRGMLTDGIRGSHDIEYNWFDFQGSNLDVVIDLGEIKRIQHIECAFYQLAAWLSIIPSGVDFLVSADGGEFENVGTVLNTLPIDQYDSYQRDFIVDFQPRDARYVRVVAHTIGNTPEWHPGSGQPARMHIDEIVVE
jgi:hexosaminidase